MPKSITKDMTTGNPAKMLILFAIPMILGNLFQQFYNIADSIIVGKFLGADALAAVGTSSPVVFISVAICIGMSNGFAIVISQLFGAGKLNKVKLAINTSVCTTIVLGLCFSLSALFIPQLMLKILNTSENIFTDAHSYLTIIFAGMFFQFLFNCLNSIFNALGNSLAPLVFLSISACTNIILDLLFITKLNMGINGAAYATIISQFLSVLISSIYLLIKLKSLKTEDDDNKEFFDLSLLKLMLKVGIPSTLQQSIVSIGMFLVQGLVNTYGSDVTAGYSAAVKLDQLGMLPIMNISLAFSTFVAQNIGAGKIQRVKEGFRYAMLITIVCSCLVSATFLIFQSPLMNLFVDGSKSPHVIEIGCSYLSVVSCFYFLLGIMFVANSVLRGSGYFFIFIIGSISNLGVRVILAYVLSNYIGASAIWWAIPIGWLVGSTFGIIAYRSNIWTKPKVLKQTVSIENPV